MLPSLTDSRKTAVLAALATASLAGGVWLAFGRGNFEDLYLVARWLRIWLDGGNLYGPGAITDYPPWAIVTLAPMALLPLEWLPRVWVVFSLGLAALIVWRLASVAGEDARRTGNLALLLAATGTVRSFQQFSHLSFALALGGAWIPSRIMGGLLVGLSLMKPQIGGVVLVWLLLRREWTRVAVALVVPVVLTAVYLAVAPVGVAPLVLGYRDALSSQYSNPSVLPGHSDLRLWLWQLWPDASGNLMLSAIVLLVLLAPLAAAAMRRRDGDGEIELLALCGMVSLLAIRHLSYDFVLMLPALVAWRCPPCAARRHAPRALFFGLAFLMIATIPSWAKLALAHGAPPSMAILLELDRVMCLGVWAALSWRLNRRAVSAAVSNRAGLRWAADSRPRSAASTPAGSSPTR